MKIKQDETADALYIQLADKPYAYGKDLDDQRRIDFDVNDQPIGIEILSVSKGVLTDDLPERASVEKALEQKGIKTYV